MTTSTDESNGCQGRDTTMARREDERMVMAGRAGTRVAAAMAIVLATWTAGERVSAVEQRALPPFQVQAPDGAKVGTGQLALPGRQALVYVDAECGSCAALFAAMAGLDAAEAEAVTFLVRGDGLSAASLMSRLTATMPNVRWFIDEGGTAYTALQIETTPVVLGLKSGRIVWARAGQVTAAASLNAALRSWLGPEPSAPSKP
jgi:hypothetical protein